jgi:hypothetical protein
MLKVATTRPQEAIFTFYFAFNAANLSILASAAAYIQHMRSITNNNQCHVTVGLDSMSCLFLAISCMTGLYSMII